MPWFTVDDRFHSHAKTAWVLAQKRGKEALALWTLAGSWCAEQLSDGHLPEHRVVQLGFRREHAELLVAAGLWERVEGGYLFHGWDERNPSREEVLAGRSKTLERVQRWRQKTRGNATSNGVTNGAKSGVTKRPGNALQTLLPDPSSQSQKDLERGGGILRSVKHLTHASGRADEEQAPPAPPPWIQNLPESEGDSADAEPGPLSAVWQQLTGQCSTTIDGQLREIEARIVASPRRGDGPLDRFRRAAKAFADDCERQGKRPVLSWLLAQWPEWDSPPKRARSAHDSSDTEARMRRESMAADARIRAELAAEDRERLAARERGEG